MRDAIESLPKRTSKRVPGLPPEDAARVERYLEFLEKLSRAGKLRTENR